MKTLSQLRAECPEGAMEARNYWDEVLQNLPRYSGWSIEEFSGKIDTTIKKLQAFSKELDELSKDCGTSKLIWASTSIGVGTAAIFLAHFKPRNVAITAWASFTTILVWLLVFCANKDKRAIEKKTAKKAHDEAKEASDMISYFLAILSEYIMLLKKPEEYLQPPSKIPKLPSAGDRRVDQCINNPTCTPMEVASAVSTGSNLIAAVEVRRLGSNLPKLLSSAVAALGIGFSIHDFVKGTFEIRNGSDVAKCFRKVANCMEKDKNEILKAYEELTKNVLHF